MVDKKYAIIRLNGRQWKVSEGDIISVEKINDKGIVPEVLLCVDEKSVNVGSPVVKKAEVKIKLIEDVKGDKVKVSKYKAKSRYRKTIGFRPQLTKVLIEKITV